jgi:uroporphyrinogen-III synthase
VTPAAPLPLHGVRVAVTRAPGRGGALDEALRAAGATVHAVPLTRTVRLPLAPLVAEAGRLDAFDWVLLTSATAVAPLAEALAAAGTREGMASRHLAVVGEATAAAAAEQGWPAPALRPARANAEGMVDAFASREDVEGARMLYPAAAGARDVLPAGLRALGAQVTVVPTYVTETDPAGQAQLAELVRHGALDLVLVAAPSAVDALQAALPPEWASRVPVGCIGPVTARAARLAGFPVRVESPDPAPGAWVAAIRRALVPPSVP